MKPDDKNKLYVVKRALKRGDLPTAKTIHWLVELLEELQKDLDHLSSLSSQMINENERLQGFIINGKDDASKKIGDVFMEMARTFGKK